MGGPLVELRAVGKSYGAASVLRNVDLTVEDGEFLVVLGPSGSGKTTILRMIGGFTDPTTGQVLLDGAVINTLPINRRPFNTVFQDYALFPHLRVRDNVGYGLRVRGLPRREIAERTAHVLDLVSLGALADRYPAQLSGGQKQRVALARAIVCQPRLILLDEPLAALDVDLRHQMQMFLKDLQRQIRTSFLFITHDQEEAIALADRICVMDHGAVVQVGPPRDLYDRPNSAHVARFFGDNNLLSGVVETAQQGTALVRTGLGTVTARCDPATGLAAGDPALMMIRPEKIAFVGADRVNTPTSMRVAAHVESVAFAGPLTRATVTAGPGGAIRLLVKRLSDTGPAVTEGPCEIAFADSDCWVVRP